MGKNVTFDTISNAKTFSVRKYTAGHIAEVICENSAEVGIQVLTEYFGVRGSPRNFEQKGMQMMIPYLLTVNDARQKQD